MPITAKKLYIKTYGCQMNVYDSERIKDVMRPFGYQPSETPENADLVVLNTCHIREKAAEKVYSELGKLRNMKKDRARAGQDMTIAVAGCVAQAEGGEIMRRQPAVDMVLGPQSYHRLPEMLARNAREQNENLAVDFDVVEKFDHLAKTATARKPDGPTAFLSVQEGCDKFCTFCVVPYTRGAEYSRPVDEIVAEARQLAGKGVKELTLLGQNVNAYHGRGPSGDAGETWGLAELMHFLAKIGGIERLRYTTSHPRDMDEALIAAHGELDVLMPYLHLPVQSGSNRILKAMNRGHTREDYLKIFEKVRAARPDIALASDFIVGFPGESDQDFEETMELVREVRYASAFSFKYSKRPGTPGAAMHGQIAEEIKNERLQALQALLREQQTVFNRSLIGTTQRVLFTSKGRKEGQIIGRSPYLQSVYIEGDEGLIGQSADIDITGATLNSLTGQIRAQNAA